ncbi:MAG: DUF2358 domain-containing protein [Limnoraphis sp. WC205]|jgi:hypothetical protein|nr:DUF2358 domain-containing protein [Limnoraphis sp. WC205]
MKTKTSPPLTPEQYQAKIETVINTLKQDLPTLFEKDISYEIYTSDIYFTDPVNTFKWKFNYRIIFWTLRFHAGLFFSEIYFDLHQVQQTAVDLITADWTVRGTLRLPWKPQIFFNGSSAYHLSNQALIYRHEDTWDRSPQTILKQFFQRQPNSNPEER